MLDLCECRFASAFRFPSDRTRNCAKVVSIPVALAIGYHSDSRCKRPDFDFASQFSPRSAAAGESSHQIANRWLCNVEHVPIVSLRKLCELARVVSPHDDPGGNAGEPAGEHGPTRTRV